MKAKKIATKLERFVDKNYDKGLKKCVHKHGSYAVRSEYWRDNTLSGLDFVKEYNYGLENLCTDLSLDNSLTASQTDALFSYAEKLTTGMAHLRTGITGNDIDKYMYSMKPYFRKGRKTTIDYGLSFGLIGSAVYSSVFNAPESFFVVFPAVMIIGLALESVAHYHSDLYKKLDTSHIVGSEGYFKDIKNELIDVLEQ
jgi:hypothetical protein